MIANVPSAVPCRLKGGGLIKLGHRQVPPQQFGGRHAGFGLPPLGDLRQHLAQEDLRLLFGLHRLAEPPSRPSCRPSQSVGDYHPGLDRTDEAIYSNSPSVTVSDSADQ